ncbi:MAG TPA: ATP-binding protein [Candidatus Saccharimonadales bacterium]|nr:ATP-binding protein [Candidatus Saccharimonadales bacterium]
MGERMPNSGAPTDLAEYQKHIRGRLKTLTPVFAKAVIGDFSSQVPIPKEEDELTEFFVGVQIILDTIREKVGELETSLTDLHAANNIIASEKARVEAILDGLGEGLLTVDDSWRINYINEPAIALLGDNARILGQEATQIMRLEDAAGKLIPEAKHPVLRAIGKRRRVSVDMTKGAALYVRPGSGQERRRIALTITPILRAGRVAGAAVVLRDITEESNIDWAKSEIISIASHQLRTPLTAIKWYVAALLREEEDLTPEQTDKYLQRVYDANQHMIELVDALLNVSRIDLGTLTLLPKAVKLEVTLKEVLKELAVEIKNKELTVDVEVNHEMRPAFIDPNGVHIILQNLVSNAVKYSAKGGRVVVALQQQSQNALITVRDDGCGIPADQQRKIFTKLFRASNATKVATDGTGLGLYVTKALIERAGGRIWFDSVEGSGTTFYAIIPSKIA